MKYEFRIGSKVTTMVGGQEIKGTVVGRHGTVDYYAVRLETGETIYRYGADLTEI
jgi:hypothetical protein